MRALFFMTHPGAVRNFESTLRLLGARGHAVRLAFDAPGTAAAQALLERLLVEVPSLSAGPAPPLRGGADAAARTLRRSLDAMRYLGSAYGDAPRLVARGRQAAPPPLRAAWGALSRSPATRAALGSVLRRGERALPGSAPVARFLADEAPDAVVLTPLVEFGSPQAAYLRAALARGLPTAFLVHSWDNLTNKGLLHDVPDVTVVWNELQAAEAEEHHGVPRERVAVTGAACYDHWFERTPSRTQAELAEELGLPSGRLLVLYVCSSPFVAPRETELVRTWLAALRDRGGELSAAGVIVRPHPQNAAQWAAEDLDDPAAAIWPRAGQDPVTDEARDNYFDSLAHAAAVVGLNTSALVEAAILARPVHAIALAESRGVQEGTLHFRHLAAGSGHLHVSRSLDEHVLALERSLGDPAGAIEPSRRFVEAFLRPCGLDRPATPLVVDALERLV